LSAAFRLKGRHVVFLVAEQSVRAANASKTNKKYKNLEFFLKNLILEFSLHQKTIAQKVSVLRNIYKQFLEQPENTWFSLSGKLQLTCLWDKRSGGTRKNRLSSAQWRKSAGACSDWAPSAATNNASGSRSTAEIAPLRQENKEVKLHTSFSPRENN